MRISDWSSDVCSSDLVEHLLRRGGRTLHRGRLRTAGQDDALWRERRDLVRVVVPGPDFAVDAQLADGTRDQLRVLRAAVADEDLVGVEYYGGPGMRGRRGMAEQWCGCGSGEKPSFPLLLISAFSFLHPAR